MVAVVQEQKSSSNGLSVRQSERRLNLSVLYVKDIEINCILAAVEANVGIDRK